MKEKSLTKVAKTVVYCILVVIFSIGALEAGVRLFMPQHYSKFFSFSTEQWPKADQDWLRGLRLADDIGFEATPNQFNMNNFGFFDKERKLEKSPGIYRIIVLGDSVSTTGAPPFPMLLEWQLNKTNAGRVFEVWNCAFPTYDTFFEKNLLKKKAINYYPDLILIGFCLNDFDTAMLGLKVNGRIVLYNMQSQEWANVNTFLFSYSHLYRLFTNLSLSARARMYNQPLAKTEKFRKVLLSLEEIKKIALTHNIPLLVVVFPYLKNFRDYSAEEQWSYRSIIEILTQLNIPYIDMKVRLEKENNWQLFRNSQKQWDYVHINQLGHQCTVEAIYESLKAQGIVKN